MKVHYDALIVVGSLILSGLPLATASASCDLAAIKSRSVEDAATLILEYSDIVGLGTVFEENVSGSQRQSIIFMANVKGSPGVVTLEPYAKGKLSKQDSSIRQFYYPKDTVHLFALKKTDDGFVVWPCISAEIGAHPVSDLYISMSKLKK